MARKLLLFVLVLLLISVGLAVAQSTMDHVVQRFVIAGGGSAGSAKYTVTSVIGQPAIGGIESENYKVSGGFLIPFQRHAELELWLPVILK